MDTIIATEHRESGAPVGDILLWFQRHCADSFTPEYHHLTKGGDLKNYALCRAAHEITGELDPERYEREKAEWYTKTDKPYTVLRRMLWGRFRHYWNPVRESGQVWLWYRMQTKKRDEERRRERLRGAEKRHLKEEQEIDRLGLAKYNQRMAREKQDSIALRASRVDRTSTQFLKFLDWRESADGKKYDSPPHYDIPRTVFCHPQTPETKSGICLSIVTYPTLVKHTVGVTTPRDIYDLLVLLVDKPIYGVKVLLLHTVDVATVATPHVLSGGTIQSIRGMNREQNCQQRKLISFANGYFGWGETATPYQLFPDEWKNYEGLEAPLGNPKITGRAYIVRNLKDCIVQATIEAPGVSVTVKTGAQSQPLTPSEIRDMYFLDAIEKARRKALEDRREKAIRYQLRDRCYGN